MKIRMSQKDVEDAMQLWVDYNMTGDKTVSSVRKEAGPSSDTIRDVYVFVQEPDGAG